MIPGLGLLITGFWMFMIYDCVQNEPDKNTWIWLLIFLNVAGAFIYFLTRWLPRNNFYLPKFFNKWTRQRELWAAEAAARNIGKAHQFVVLGNILSDMGMLDKAYVAYQDALAKEPENPQALWGTALIDMANKNFASAKNHLETLLKINPEYKYGEPSLAYGKVLTELQDIDAAIEHLEKHIRYWGHGEAYIILATILSKQGKNQEACSYLETMLSRLRGSTYYHYQRNQHLVKKAQQLLATLKSKS